MLLIWAGFLALILVILMLDLGVFHRRAHVIGIGEALVWSAVWIAVALAFNVAVYFLYQYHLLGIGLHIGHSLTGRDAALKYFTAYLLEESLSVDNMFVIAMIFTFFAVPPLYQHRVLFWGILGAMVMRGIMIGAGTWLINSLVWMTYVFGALLILTAVKMLITSEQGIEPERNVLVRLARRFYPVTTDYHGQKFFVRVEGRKTVTPLLLVLLVIESSDLLFAVDSIPAVLAVTYDPFIVFTSNIFAILGLRSLYFALAGMMHRFRYLKLSLVFLLAFIGTKMLLAHFYEIPTHVTLVITAGILSVGVLASLMAAKRELHHPEPPLTEELDEAARFAWRTVRRAVVLIVGSAVLLAGIIMIFTPGPAILAIPLGLAILAIEFQWARNLLKRVITYIDRKRGKTGPAPEPTAPASAHHKSPPGSSP